MSTRRCALLPFALLLSMPASAAVLRVGTGCTYTTLQAALNAAQSGDELRMVKGIEDTNVIIEVGGIYVRGGFADCSASVPGLSERTTLRSAASGRPIVSVASGVTGVVLERLILSGADNRDPDPGMGEGGGLSLGNGADVSISVTEFVGNLASRGAGAFVGPGATLASGSGLNTGLRFANNIAEAEGGAIHANHGAKIDFMTHPPISLRFEENEAALDGAAIYVGLQSSALLNGAVFDSNAASYYGGAIALDGGDLHLIDGEYRSNHAQYGGALFLRKPTGLLIEGGRFQGNTATHRGGAIDASIHTASLIIRESSPAGGGLGTAPRFESNEAGSGGGGAIFFHSNAGRVLMIGNAASEPLLFEDNTTTGNGGALHLVSATAQLPQNMVVTGNTATNGGAIAANAGATFWLRADHPEWTARFEGNQASECGGAFHAIAEARLTLDWALVGNDPLHANHAAKGGGLCLTGGSATLRNSRLLRNDATSAGGGLHAESQSVVIVEGITGTGSSSGTQPLPLCQPWMLPANRYCSEIAGNRVTAALGTGGGVSAKYADVVDIRHTAILDNAAWYGAAVHQWNESPASFDTVLVSGHDAAFHVGADSLLALQSVTIAGNTGTAITLADAAGTTLLAFDSILWGNAAGIDGGDAATIDGDCNVTQDARVPGLVFDPAFASNPRGAFRLSEFSVARDLCASGTSVDLDGLARPYGLNSDAGAFEYVDFPDRIFADGFE